MPEIAKRLKVSKSKLYSDQRAGKLIVHQFGRILRVRQQDFDRYVRLASARSQAAKD